MCEPTCGCLISTYFLGKKELVELDEEALEEGIEEK